MEPDVYNQVFTMHGTVMMFLFAVPMMEGLAVYLIPKMIGARDLVFPRLSALGYYCYLFGGLILLSGGPDGPVDPLFVQGRGADAAAALDEMRRVFGDRFYVELQRHGLPDETR
ncbi:cbb3-type cytochrome c oxidase subunit I, partial [Klebsiella pneumoniae]|uniref:cbb3-type cytochrome c oxidase subunit I n=1 Tax=Klebsiella pneumoniae TaxID=573 RepID=UPI00210CFCA7